MLTSVFHLFPMNTIDVTREIPVALALISFLTWPRWTMFRSRGWLQDMIIQRLADDAIIILRRMPWSMVSFFIKPPPHAWHLSSLEWGSRFTISRKIYWGDPLVLYFFFLHREDNRTMTRRHLEMHHCPRSICLLQVHHLTSNFCSRKRLFFFPVVKLFPTNICWFVLAGHSRSSNSTRQVLDI